MNPETICNKVIFNALSGEAAARCILTVGHKCNCKELPDHCPDHAKYSGQCPACRAASSASGARMDMRDKGMRLLTEIEAQRGRLAKIEERLGRLMTQRADEEEKLANLLIELQGAA